MRLLIDSVIDVGVLNYLRASLLRKTADKAEGLPVNHVVVFFMVVESHKVQTQQKAHNL